MIATFGLLTLLSLFAALFTFTAITLLRARPRFRPAKGFIMSLPGWIVAGLMLMITAPVFAQSGVYPANQLNGAGQPSIAQGRNLTITTTNDSTKIVTQSPTGITNDIIDSYAGSQPVFGVQSNGAVNYFGQTNGVTTAQQNLRIDNSGPLAAPTIGALVSNAFHFTFESPPTVIFNGNTNTVIILNISTVGLTYSNLTGTGTNSWMAIGN